MESVTTESESTYRAVGEFYFDLNGDTELFAMESEDPVEKQLSWREKEPGPFSNWRIVIVTKSHKPRTYYVHKNVLSTGSRSSNYFARLFSQAKALPQKDRSNNNIVSNSSSTKIELEDRDAKNFPILLDFIYIDATMPTIKSSNTADTAAATEASSVQSSTSCQLTANSSLEEDRILNLGPKIDTMNSTSLRHLSRLLGCDNLTISINHFIQRDLSFRTGPVYYKHAHEYKDERLAEAAKRLCSENFEQISVKNLMRLPIHLMKELVTAAARHTSTNKSTALSEVVYIYLERHPEYLNPESLLDLTDSVPAIGPEPAIGFTALVKDLDQKACLPHWARLVNLCKKCAEAVVGRFGWTDFSIAAALDDYLDPQNRRSHIDSLLFATSFAAALQRAQNDRTDLLAREEKVEKTVHQLKKTILKKEHQIRAQQKALEDARRQIESQKRGKKMSDLPSTPSTSQKQGKYETNH